MAPTRLEQVGENRPKGRLTLPVRAVPWFEAAHAHRLVEDSHVRGKVVLML
ncbi:MAG: zinc-binding dehydrogenase [Nocardiopsaceae bacterium]|nr:zinc-binding dehydrogenase [Nocardiopsaceae bacterium]